MPRPRNGRRIPRPSGFSGRTAWARSAQTPLRNFLRTETGGAAVLLAAAIAALIWVNIDESSYERLWRTMLSIRLGDAGITLDLRGWVNSGLMTLFFLVVGLEARREFDIGELRERRRFALPLVAGLSGVAVSVAIYLAINAGRTSAGGWGVAMSTDTAFALGLLALVGPRFPDRLRAFMLTVVVVDDVVAVIVIATVYSETLHIVPLLVAVALLGAILIARRFRVPAGVAFATLGTAAWVAMLKSGVEPVVVGLVLGLLTYAFPPPRSRLEGVTERVREFREQPTAELARVAQVELRSATSANERLQQRFHPWTSYLVVPVFALANAGIAVSGSVLSSAFSSPITLGILFGYVVGKPVGIVGSSWLLTVLSRRRLRPPVGWAAVAGEGLSPASGSRSLCWSQRSPSTDGSSSKPRSASSALLSAQPLSRGCCSARRRCCLGGYGSGACSGPTSQSSTSTSMSTRNETTIEARSMRRSLSSSTAISNAPTAVARSRSCGSSCRSSETSGTSGAICR